MSRTQKDRDEDLAIGRELERKDAEIDRLLRVSADASSGNTSLLDRNKKLNDENERLRAALARVERLLQPIDNAENIETAGRAREHALFVLNAARVAATSPP